MPKVRASLCRGGREHCEGSARGRVFAVSNRAGVSAACVSRESGSRSRRHLRGAAWSRRRSRATAEAVPGRHMRVTSSRPGAQQEFAKGFGFDAEREDIDMLAMVRDWEKNDELMWRFIVSPEDAARLNLRDHVRDLVGQMERDLGTQARMGRDRSPQHRRRARSSAGSRCSRKRQPLEINRDYLRSGIRIRSQEFATRELGPRLEPEILQVARTRCSPRAVDRDRSLSSAKGGRKWTRHL